MFNSGCLKLNKGIAASFATKNPFLSTWKVDMFEFECLKLNKGGEKNLKSHFIAQAGLQISMHYEKWQNVLLADCRFIFDLVQILNV